MKNLANAPWLCSPAVQAVFDAIEQNGDTARAVGGAVRNTLLKTPVSDVDIATTAIPSSVSARAEAHGLTVVPTGIDHGTVTVISAGISYEVTTLRRDVETFGRQARVIFGKSWSEDARRRDFTLNALYADRHGEIFDPLEGLEDCLARRVRFIGEPADRIREDYLRILRFFRIHATYGDGPVDADGLHACINGREGLRQLSAERVGMEMKKLVSARLAADCLELMEASGLLGIVTGGVSRIADFKALRELDEHAPETRTPALGLAVLAGFTDEDLDRIADRFRLSNAMRNRMHGAHAVWSDPRARNPTAALRHLLYRRGRETVVDGLLAIWALTRAQEGNPEKELLFAKSINDSRVEPIPVFPLRGRNLIEIGVLPGPELGIKLSQLEEIWVESEFKMSRDELLFKI